MVYRNTLYSQFNFGHRRPCRLAALLTRFTAKDIFPSSSKSMSSSSSFHTSKVSFSIDAIVCSDTDTSVQMKRIFFRSTSQRHSWSFFPVTNPYTDENLGSSISWDLLWVSPQERRHWIFQHLNVREHGYSQVNWNEDGQSDRQVRLGWLIGNERLTEGRHGFCLGLC